MIIIIIVIIIMIMMIIIITIIIIIIIYNWYRALSTYKDHKHKHIIKNSGKIFMVHIVN